VKEQRMEVTKISLNIAFKLSFVLKRLMQLHFVCWANASISVSYAHLLIQFSLNIFLHIYYLQC